MKDAAPRRSLPRPPWLARRLVETLARGERGEAVAGDLEEGFLRRLAIGGTPRAARRWYWRNGLASALALLAHRFRQREPRGRGGVSMGSVLHDVRIAARTLSRQPSFSGVVILTLGLGIGATAALFSVAHATLLRPLPYPDPDRLVWIFDELESDRSLVMASLANVRDWRSDAKSVQRLACARTGTVFIGGGERAERLFARYVEPDYLALLGARTGRGRLFDAGDDRAPGAHAVAILSHGLWSRRFGRDPSIVGRSVELSGVGYEIVGVLAPGFREPFPGGRDGDIDVWLPLLMAGPTHPMGDRIFTERRWRPFAVFARLASGATVQQAEAELDTIADALETRYPDANAGFGVGVRPLQELVTASFRRPVLLILAGACVLLVIGCFNVANLMLVRAAGRTREWGVRLALGAGRGTLARGLAVEAALLAAAGGAVGVAAAAALLPALLRFSPAQLPSFADVRLDVPTLLGALAVTLLSGLLCGIAPALRASRLDPCAAVAGGTRHGADRSGARVRSGLVVFEVATAMVLLATAALLVRGFDALVQLDSGFVSRRLQTVQVRLVESRYPESDDVVAAAGELRRRLEALPGTLWADTWGPGRPGMSLFFQSTLPRGRVARRITDSSLARRHSIGPGMLARLGIPLQRGREFSEADAADREPVVVLSQALAEELWPGQDPLGRRAHSYRALQHGGPTWTVVGVVADARHGGRLPVPGTIETNNDIYFPLAQRPERDLTIVVRTAQEPSFPALRDALLELDPDLPLYDAATMEELFDDEHSPARFAALLMGGFAAAALLLAGLGVYGVVAFSVGQRVPEMALRTALGAEAAAIVGLVLGQGMRLALSGVLLGSLAALASQRVLVWADATLDGTDPSSLVLAAVALVGIAGLACAIPALRAARIAPASLLRV